MITRIRPRRLAALARRELPRPVDVVNLIATSRFDRYRWYALLVWPALVAVGARVLWMGRSDGSAAGAQQGDKLLIVRYPSHRHFLAMTLNPYYLTINRLREAGVRRFEASFTHASHRDPGLARRPLLVGVHYQSRPGVDALREVAELARPVLGELVYATRAVAVLDFLEPPRDTDPRPMGLGEVALFAPAGDALPDGEALSRLANAVAEVTDESALQVYRREPRRAYRPALGRRQAAAVAACTAALLATAAPAGAQVPAMPIPGPLDGPLPRYEGAPVQPQPLDGPWPAANPALAPDGRSGSGLAAANGAASPLPGPLGHGTDRASTLQFGNCASLAFDAGDRLLSLCNGLLGPALRLVATDSLDTVATHLLPPRRSADRADLAGGTHFVVRADGSLLVPTNDRTLVTVEVGAASLRRTATLDLAPLLAPGERPLAVAAGFDGRDWVAGNQGTVVALPRDGAAPRALRLGEAVSEDIAAGPGGTYVVTAAALYRVRADAAGAPQVVWRHPLPRGSGTPPALVPGGLVAVADRSDPPRVVLVHEDGADAGRARCAVPVFRPGQGAVTSHLVVAGGAVVASNAHGYDHPFTTEGGATTTGGIAQVVVDDDGCRSGWTSDAVSPSAQPVVSRATGLLYTLVKPAGFPDAWNLAALDWRTGEVRFQALAGEGLGHNSEGGALVLGPDGAAYAGTFGGIVRFRDD